ncbi:MAG: hypothetical protein EOP92_22250 [Lysobacteraceae bacterium]|nr:MAG: hypothetical protein EOP92_22250 [Xanthomonadaceae bacterium]
MFSALLEAYPQIRVDLDEKAFRAFNDATKFEEGMQLALEYGSQSVAPLLRTMAKYLGRFEPCGCPENGYRQLLKGIRRNLAHINFATLNYDLLFDRVALGEGLNLNFGGPRSRAGVSVLKPHGAADLLVDLETSELENVNFVGFSNYVQAATRRANSPEEIVSWCDDPRNGSVAPVMSVYALGKRTPYNGDTVIHQRDLWSRLVLRAKRIVIVGVKLVEEDEHIWAPLAANRGAIMYVNINAGDGAAFVEWSRRTRHAAPHEFVEKGFLDAISLVTRRLAK